jgi:carbohydrate diacid regulator
MAAEHLTPQLAQTIVDRTMEIVDYNINIMNQNGVIIGSGDEGRINDLHEGAKQVIKTGQPLQISKQDEKELAGSKPGINLPINLNEETIGVVGITGTPEVVANYGGLVKMTVELMLQQAFYLEQEQQHQEIFI